MNEVRDWAELHWAAVRLVREGTGIHVGVRDQALGSFTGLCTGDPKVKKT